MAATIDGTTGLTSPAGGVVNPSTTVDGINYSCRAWVNFNGTGTVAIRASGNVTSITDNGLGDYTVNFTNAFSDINYAPAALINGGASITVPFSTAAPTTTAYRVETRRADTSNPADSQYVNIAFFR
jgi:hypothetical protein